MKTQAVKTRIVSSVNSSCIQRGHWQSGLDSPIRIIRVTEIVIEECRSMFGALPETRPFRLE